MLPLPVPPLPPVLLVEPPPLEPLLLEPPLLESTPLLPLVPFAAVGGDDGVEKVTGADVVDVTKVVLELAGALLTLLELLPPPMEPPLALPAALLPLEPSVPLADPVLLVVEFEAAPPLALPAEPPAEPPVGPVTDVVRGPLSMYTPLKYQSSGPLLSVPEPPEVLGRRRTPKCQSAPS